MNIKEKVAFIKGLMEGMNFENNSNEKKFFDAVVDILSDISLEIEDLKDDNEYLNDYVEELDEDLGDLEEFVYDSEVGEDDDEEEFEDDDFVIDDDEEEYDDDTDGICKMECDCGKLVDINPDNIKDGKIVCPYCLKEYDINEICEGCEGCEGCK